MLLMEHTLGRYPVMAYPRDLSEAFGSHKSDIQDHRVGPGILGRDLGFL